MTDGARVRRRRPLAVFAAASLAAASYAAIAGSPPAAAESADTTATSSAPTPPAGDPAPVVVDIAEVRRAAPVRIYKLEREVYDFQLRAARRLASERGLDEADAATVDGVAEPARPRLELDAADLPRRGPGAAPVEIVVVENLAQIYTQRLDRKLERIVGARDGKVAVRSLPYAARTHRTSLIAAQAALCAARAERYWDMRALLNEDLYAQDRATVTGYATRLGLAAEDFEACLDDEATRTRALDLAARAKQSGIEQSPTVLVNGVYVGGVEPQRTLERVIDAALAAAEDAT